MSIFAYVFCVLLVATATTAVDDVLDLHLTTAMLAEVKNAVEPNYEAAKKIADKVLMTMKLEIPPEMDSWPRIGKTPFASCFKFVKKGIKERSELVASCSSPSLPGTETIDSLRAQLDMVIAPLRMSIDEPKDVADFCAAWFYNSRDSATRTVICKIVVNQGAPAMIAKARGAIGYIVRQVIDVANNWVVEAGHCLVKPNVGYTKIAWLAACPRPYSH